MEEMLSLSEMRGRLSDLGFGVLDLGTIRRRLHDHGLHQTRSERWEAYIAAGRWNPNLKHLPRGEDHPGWKGGNQRWFGGERTKTCRQCGGPFSFPEGQGMKAKQKYCSPACAHAAKRTLRTLTKTCETCQNKFQCRGTDAPDREYCSRPCYWQAERTLPTLTKTCEFCTKTFRTRRSDASERKFCNTTCSSRFHNRRRSRELYESKVVALHKEGYSVRGIIKELFRRWPNYRWRKRKQQKPLPISRSSVQRILAKRT